MTASGTVALRPMSPGPEAEAAVQALHERAADYVHRITGDAPPPDAGRQFFTALPPGKTAADKHTFGVVEGDALVGCVDLVRGWPDAQTAVIGLLLLEPSARGRVIGRAAFEAIEDQARAWPEIERLRLVVVESNDVARPFWERLGFRATGQTRPHEVGRVRSTAHVFHKALDRP